MQRFGLLALLSALSVAAGSSAGAEIKHVIVLMEENRSFDHLLCDLIIVFCARVRRRVRRVWRA